MSNPYIIEPIGKTGLPLLRDLYARLQCDPQIERDSVDLDRSFFAWPAESGNADPAGQTDRGATTPAGFGLLGIRRHGDTVAASIRAVATLVGVGTADPRPALLSALVQAASAANAATLSAEGAVDPDDSPLQPPAPMLEKAGLWEISPLLGFTAERADVLAEPVYLQIGLHDITAEELDDFESWFKTVDTALPWPLQSDALPGIRFPDTTYVMVASGFAAGFMAVTDPQMTEAALLQLWVLPDLRRQQIALGALQEVLNAHHRLERFTIQPVIPEGNEEWVAFLEAVGFRRSGERRILMEVRLAK